MFTCSMYAGEYNNYIKLYSGRPGVEVMVSIERSPSLLVTSKFPPTFLYRCIDFFFNLGRDQVKAFLTRKWEKEQGYRLKKHLWAFEVIRYFMAPKEASFKGFYFIALLSKYCLDLWALLDTRNKKTF